MAQTRVAIVANAHALNPEAANAFLKVLEEPPERTVILLTAFQLSDLLPTIVSRCQHIRFNPISRKRVKEYLIEHCQADPEIAGLAASLSNGSLKKGISIIDGQWLDSRNWLLDEIQRLFHRPVPVSLALGEKLSKNRETAQDFMEIMDTWLRDIIVCRFAGDNTINKDRLEILLEISNKIEVPAVLELIDALHTAKKHIRGNSNVRLTLEVFFLRLAKELTRVT
jgi:DNA polymerase-3 subunit delta'